MEEEGTELQNRKERKKEKEHRDRKRSRSARRDARGRSRSRSRSKSRNRSQSGGKDRERHRRSRTPERHQRSFDRRRSRRSNSTERRKKRRSSSRRRSSSPESSKNSSHKYENGEDSSFGPKPVTLKEIISANPGISMPEAVIRLNAYNTAIARGDIPPPLSTNLSSSHSAINVTNQYGNIGDNGSLTKAQREIYVGNLPPGIAVPQLAEFLNAAMKQLGFAKDGQNSVATAWISPDAHYAFVELRTIEEANAALNHLNGIQVGNYSLKIGRTKSYSNNSGTSMEVYTESPNIGGLTSLANGILNPALSNLATSTLSLAAVEPLSNVIMVTDLPSVLDEQQIRDLFTPFGELKAFNLIKSVGQGQSAVFEYTNSAVTDGVVGGMNNLDVAGCRISVQRVPVGSAAVLLKPAKSASEKVSNPPQTEEMKAATRVLCLSNMVNSEDLLDDELYSDLIEDVAEECNLHSTVESVIIPRTKGKDIDDSALGRVFVQLKDIEGSIKVFKVVSGRKFNGKTVHASFYPEDLFLQKIYVYPPHYKPSPFPSTMQTTDLD